MHPNVINKNSNDMKEEILSIASDLREGSMSTSEAKEQLLVLFGVVGRSEQVVCDIFQMDSSTSSATKCKCGREKWEHTN